MKLLINSLTDLAQVVTFSGDVEFAALQPALRSAQLFLASFIGDELLAELMAEDLTEETQALLTYAVVPVGNLAMLKFVNASNVRITDMGVMRTKDANTQDAFEWQLERVVVTLKQEAFTGIENLLRYLATHLTDYPAYARSAPFKQHQQQLIPSADVFSEYYAISGSRLVFQTLLPSMRTAERAIRRIVGDLLPATPLNPDTLTEGQLDLLDTARRALAYATVARALRERLVSITDQGVQVLGISSFASINYQTAATDKQLERSINYFDEQAGRYQAELSALVAQAAPVAIRPTGPVRQVSGTSIVSF